mmetsp:Transcript_21617/g.45476  ORF Transcript_21617/g.45476 Transcript_21617/m.45476 type:complete len:213 (+) Transcript_21617:167-805(+)|eukprot:CAMPEP_0171342460 /NCGR_PEP_ID=MMETSP0878-20121228/14382_1 /TAXON_ID=67004 /ORGANISM="Thalassiosira weissflogii, Strain CCMP1336" /LENGTH=212 /DNA_ID=CAMNT_0011845143 /DNA_START=77 /DNA_END=715 /DNA_ORIENTATION=+
MRLFVFAFTLGTALSLSIATSTDEEEERRSCSSATSCSSCLRRSGCTWHATLGFCDKGCGMNGCGATKCASEITTCRQCLTFDAPAYGQYAWSPATNECLNSCDDAPADAPCYPGYYTEGAMKTYDSSDCSKIDGGGNNRNRCSSFKSNCKKCLKAGCAWSGGKCHKDCTTAPADAACNQGQRAKRNRRSICASDFFFDDDIEDMDGMVTFA